MKLLVETTGNFALLDIGGRQTVESYRPCVVTNTPFIESHRAGKLKILEVLADEASDQSLANAKDLKAAIAALPRVEEAPKPTPTAKGK